MLPEIRTLLLQIVAICTLARALGWLFARLGQSRVMGEIVAGVLLGPSLFGWVAPSAFHYVFPANSLGPLYALSQLGVVLFMFEVGLMLDLDEVRQQGSAVALTAVVSTLIPLVCGGALGIFLYPRLSSPAVNFWDYALFLGTALSITAFPVLARLLVERGLIATRVGALSLSIAAVGDIAAWCLLAVVVARSSTGTEHPLWVTMAGLLLFIGIMVGVVRPIIRKRRWFDPEKSQGLELLLGFVFVASWTTEWIGVHALFGAFFAGVVLPKSPSLTRSVSQRLVAFTSILLLPLFFAFTGLRTSVRLLNTGTLWAYCVLVIAIAVGSKLIGCSIAARSMGLSWRDALATGALLNTRGLVELVVLNVGLDMHVISPTLFSIMVVMAVVTTLMTNPLLTYIRPALASAPLGGNVS